MGILEDLGGQMLEPMRQMVGDALTVTEEMARRYSAALAALDGHYPGSVAFNGNGNSNANGNGHQPLNAVALPLALPPVPEPVVAEINLVRPEGEMTTVAEYCLAVLRAAFEARFVGSVGTPGAMRSAEVLATMIEWGWRHRLYHNAQQAVSSGLASLLPEGRVKRPDRGVYILATAEVKKPVRKHVRTKPAKTRTTPMRKPVPTGEMILSILRGMPGQPVRSDVVLAKMRSLGWETSSGAPLSVICTTLCQLIRTHPQVTRTAPGEYVYTNGHSTGGP